MEGSVLARVKRARSTNSARSQIARQFSTRNNLNLNGKMGRSSSARSNSFRNINHQRLKSLRSEVAVAGSDFAPPHNNQIIANNVYNSNLENGNNQSDELKTICAGNFTREVYNAIYPRMGHTLHIPEDSMQGVFNDLHLYPTSAQVSEMLQSARQVSRRNGASKYITFAEFCVFAREMQNQRRNKTHTRKLQQSFKQQNNNKCKSNCEVFLGGSCNPTTWRADTAIPELQKHGITFYNPQVLTWVPELLAQEHDAKHAAAVLLFVVDSQTRSTVGMIETAYLMSSGRCVVVVAQPYRLDQTIMGEKITYREYKDLVEGQTTLLVLVKSRGVKVHTTLPSALQSIANILRNSSNNDVTAEEHLSSKLRVMREVFDSYSNQHGEITLFEVLDAFYKLTQRNLSIGELYKYLSSSTENSKTINFDQFCMLVAEYTSENNCDTCTSNGKAVQSFHSESPTNNNTCNLDNARIIQDIDSVKSSFLNNTMMTYKKVDVFLGGTCNAGIDWRENVAIPILKKHGISYYNPSVRENNASAECNGFVLNDNKSDNDLLKWKQIMDGSKVQLFVITNDTRSLTTMVLAAHYLPLRKDMVLVIQELPEEVSVIGNETLSHQAIKDYNRGRVYLDDMAKRNQIPVFENITKAVECVVDMCQSL